MRLKPLWLALAAAIMLAPGAGQAQATYKLNTLAGGFTWDSGSVAAGAAIASPVLDLRDVRELLVVVDNTAGTTFRNLTLVSYLDNGTTQIDSLLLRRVAFGAAATGSSYAPGAVRGTVGTGVAIGTPGSHILYDATSAANAALATPAIVVDGMQVVSAIAAASAGTTVLTGRAPADDDTASALGVLGGGTAALRNHCSIGAGAYGGSSGSGSGGGFAMPRRIIFDTTTAGGGNTVRLIVVGYGLPPGTFVVQLALPPKAKLTLAAGGAAAARMTVVAKR